MEQKKRRIMVSITPEIAQGLDDVKREQFYNKPYSEVFRYVFSLGLKAANAREKAEKECFKVS